MAVAVHITSEYIAVPYPLFSGGLPISSGGIVKLYVFNNLIILSVALVILYRLCKLLARSNKIRILLAAVAARIIFGNRSRPALSGSTVGA